MIPSYLLQKNKRRHYLQVLTFLLMLTGFSSCKKYLDKKSQQSLATPSSLNDLQALLNNATIMNLQDDRLIGLIDDNFYIGTDDWQAALSSVEPGNSDARNYVWDKDASSYQAWTIPYGGPIYYSNVVLDQLPNIQYDNSQQSHYNAIKGAALFYRSFAFITLAQLYCKPYTNTAATDPGICLRTTSNVEAAVTRSTVQATYDQIIKDLKAAADLLPDTTSFPSTPTRAAAYGALARAYLYMRDYPNAGTYADLALKKYSTLIDYNTVDASSGTPFQRFNKETVFFNEMVESTLLYNPTAKIDSTLYQSYDANDLRKTLFFSSNGDGTHSFQGSYDGTNYIDVPFDGIATDELYLIRAEASARNGSAANAIADLNTLMITRFKTGSFTAFTATDAQDALVKVLTERRKELIYRGTRWPDIRRFNLEGANITLTRVVGGTTYTLPSNDPRSVLLIPIEIINFSHIEQNPR